MVKALLVAKGPTLQKMVGDALANATAMIMNSQEEVKEEEKAKQNEEMKEGEEAQSAEAMEDVDQQ